MSAVAAPAFLVAEERIDQFVLGAFHLVGGLALLPVLAAGLLSAVRRLNALALGELGSWQESGFAFGKVFFAVFCFGLALHGAARLSILALAQSGLITNPWE